MTRRIKLMMMSAVAAAGVAAGASPADAHVVTTTVYGPAPVYVPVTSGCVHVVAPVPLPPPAVRVVAPVPRPTVVVPTPYRPWVGPVVVRRW